MNLKRVFKKFFTYFSVALILSIFLSFLYVFFPNLPDSFDNRLRDYLFTIRGEIANNNSVIIIDIDEKSLQELGQWPWSRDKVSKILNNLTKSNVGLIGMDIVFAEEDNSSPHKVFEKYNIQKENIPNYDLEFAKTIANTPTILGYQFEFEKNSKYINKKAPQIPAIFIEKNKKLGQRYLLEAEGTILNIPLLQDNSYSSGFFNNIPDDSGTIRSVPLIISYNDMIYPSLALETIRILSDSKRVYINYDDEGVTNITMNDIVIPTDRHGRILVNFRGKERNFKYFSALDIYNNNFNKNEIKGRIALVGTSAAGLLDLRATPFESIYPGVEVHANVIDNIIEGDFIYKASWIDGANIAIIFFLSIIVIFLITYTPFWLTPIISIFLIFITTTFIYQILFKYGIVLNIFFPLFTIISASILATLFDYFYAIKKEEAIKEKFASKVSKEVMDRLLKDMDSNKFQAMEKEVTIFFSDIRGFTKISEEMDDAKNLITYLNKYMEPMSNIIVKYQGTIDKYIGDAIMAYWNAPADVENHADKAVQASLEQINELSFLNKKLKEKNLPLIDIGIGINTGLAIVGEMGSIGRSDYTVIGDAINLGARLESLCKYYDSRLNISNFTKKELKEKYIFRFLDKVKVKGKDEAVEIWQVIAKGKVHNALIEELESYHNAIKLYKETNFKEALVRFKILENNEKKTNKNIYKIYIERCEEFIISPPENFDGIYEHITKG
ncbi:MAG: adenylate/guanylate cyclase domain-containing protein [Arcobacter sp.]|nr:MAG: adenylate/guanylate cyclase domain-containing protein [Arcobacter sp.]